MKKNIIKTIKITSEMNEEIVELAEETGLKQTDIIRQLISRGIFEVREERIKSGGHPLLKVRAL